jgi:thioester reductase-like protein
MGLHLVTGFPGFLGARLLPRLLELRPDDRVVCLVQAKFADFAKKEVARLEELHPHVRGRMDLVEGDIVAEGLGLRDARLKKKITGAFHLAAVYDLAVGRDFAFKVNVLGTRHVLHFLADCAHLERHHYVSTCYVSGDHRGTFKETDLELGQGFKNFYEETKYLAEVEVAKSGLPTTVYRPGIVVGDSRTGETAKFDGPYFVMTAMERLPSPGVFLRLGDGKAPAGLVPVDYVIEALARLATSKVSLGKTYQLTDPEPLTAFEVSQAVAKALGRTFVYLPMPTLLARPLFQPKFVQDLLGLPLQALDYFDHDCRYDTTQAVKDLGPMGVRCPRFSDYVGTLVAFYRKERDRVRRTAMV